MPAQRRTPGPSEINEDDGAARFLTPAWRRTTGPSEINEDGGVAQSGTSADEDVESMEYEQNPDYRTRVANVSSRQINNDDLMQDIITVECNKLNGKLFNGTVNFSEAKTKIFQDGLGLDANLLGTVQIKFNKCPVITFKLKSKNFSHKIKHANLKCTNNQFGKQH